MSAETITDRPKPTGRGKGRTNLSDDVKVGVLSQKKLQIITQDKIAEEFGLCRATVNRMTEDDLSPEGQLTMKSFVDKLAEAREKTINRINEKLDNNDFKDGVYPNLLNAVNSNYRLETNQSTQNVAVKVRDEIRETLLAKGWDEEKVEAKLAAWELEGKL